MAATTALVLVAGLVSTTVSYASPDDDDVAAAQQAVTDAASSVAAIEVALAQLSTQVDAAWVAVAVAAEDYTQALVAQDAADQLARESADREAAAEAALEDARTELGTIAQEAYRSGGSLDGVAVLLAADGIEDYVARSTALDQLGGRADRLLQRFDAADLVARTFADRAGTAAQEARDAAAAAQTKLAQARDLQAVAEEQVREVAAQRETLITQLAGLRQTSIEVERARQDAIEAERTSRPPASPASNGPLAPPASPPPPPTPSAADPGPPGTTPPSDPPSTPAPGDPYGLGTGSQRGTAEQGQAAVAWALQQVGKPYVYGAAGPDSFDCSGLTMRAWGAAGLAIHRTSRDQYLQSYKIAYDSMRPGDLIFYGTVASDPGSVYHVVMYIGDGQIVEASRPGVPVRVTPVRWSSTMPYAGRP